MSIEKGDIITARIKCETNEGKVYFSNLQSDPIELKIDDDCYFQGIEKIIPGMNVGEKKSASLDADDAFGKRKADRIKCVARGLNESDVKEGDEIMLFDTLQGRPIPGKVLQANEKTLTIDFNHELCGKNVNYEVEVLGVRK